MTEARASTEPTRSVMVDVGAGFGALVLRMPPEFQGEEIEVSPISAPDRRQHVYVLPRMLPRGTAFAAVYPRLPAGDHLIWSLEGDPVMTVNIQEGSVAQAAWPSMDPASLAPTNPTFPAIAGHKSTTTTKGD
jgi:hypothetical protein